MLSADELDRRREAIGSAPDLAAALARLGRRVDRIVAQRPAIPDVKALLSADGGVCPDDGSALVFDPWSPRSHRCPTCGRGWSGGRHDRSWARFQHLWLGERIAELAAVAVLDGREDAAAAANELLAGYGERYLDFPNRDNVLGPSRLFFSTYLESIWICNAVAGASLLRDAGLIAPEAEDGMARIAEEAATLIGEFDEGMSNRQTWNASALAAIGVWFEDEALAERAIGGPTGLLAHLAAGFGPDGFWYEGENYHLFALRGLLTGLGWARLAGVDAFAEPKPARRIHAALRAPAVSALPDRTFPARKDSRFGVSLAQPMYLELWEVGLARLAANPAASPEAESSPLWRWLADLYAVPAPAAQTFDSYLHEAGEPAPSRRSRADLSWWSLLSMRDALPAAAEPWTPASELLEGQGLAILREGGRYVSLECGPQGGGHGHADRLHLTLFADDVLWLPDPGTGSYVARDLFWYRSTMAHNAPLLDGASQPPGAAAADAFDTSGGWSWVRGRFDGCTRTVVSGPDRVLDVVELSAGEDHALDLPWHPAGDIIMESAGAWEAAELDGEFVRAAERWRAAEPGAVRVRATVGDASLRIWLAFAGELLRATAPGVPGRGPAPMLLVRTAPARHARVVTVLEPGGAEKVRGVRVSGDAVELDLADGIERHAPMADGWEVRSAEATVRLAGRRQERGAFEPFLTADRPARMEASAPGLGDPPALDGTLAGFDTAFPLALDHEDQYRRSEESYAGSDNFSAVAWVNWSDAGLHLAVDVVRPEPIFRRSGAPPLRLDNEPDDIHSDGLQVYLRVPDAAPVGFLVVPEPGTPTLRVSPVAGTAARTEMVHGAWTETDAGYRVTLAILPPGWSDLRAGDAVGFDLVVNEMAPDRERRAGQLVWTGGGGWVWLRGDRQDPERFGTVTLA